MADKPDHFVEGLFGSHRGKYTPSYRYGQAWRNTIDGIFAPLKYLNKSNSNTFSSNSTSFPSNSAWPSSAPIDARRPSTASDPYGSAWEAPSSPQKRGAGWKVRLVTAIIGAVVFAALVGSTAGQSALWPWVCGAIAGWILPTVLSALGKLILLVVRLLLGLLRLVFWLALIAAIIYGVVLLAGIAK